MAHHATRDRRAARASQAAPAQAEVNRRVVDRADLLCVSGARSSGPVSSAAHDGRQRDNLRHDQEGISSGNCGACSSLPLSLSRDMYIQLAKWYVELKTQHAEVKNGGKGAPSATYRPCYWCGSPKSVASCLLTLFSGQTGMPVPRPKRS